MHITLSTKIFDNNVFQNIFDTFVRFKPQEQNAWSWNSLQSKIKVTNSFERADEEVNENFLAPWSKVGKYSSRKGYEILRK